MKILKIIGVIIGVLALLMGQIYLCTYTTTPTWLLYITPTLISAVTAVTVGGVKGKISNVVADDDQGNSLVSLTWGAFFIMMIATYAFTIIAISER